MNSTFALKQLQLLIYICFLGGGLNVTSLCEDTVVALCSALKEIGWVVPESSAYELTKEV